MFRSRSLVLLSIVILTFALPESATAQNKVLLGERHVTDLSERDTINVGKDSGAFKSVQVKATGGAVEFKRVVIHFENGSEQVFEKNRLLTKGKQSGQIDLDGDSRYIDKVVLYYEARTKGRKGADITLWGVR
ncbi:MAG: DUF2541 family protein [Xanthomonadales bacterium]|nr:DUF2541 family protein [Xanthomonadales bacterium]